MRHDVINDRYGRLYHLPDELSRLGHDIYGCCLSYQNMAKENQTHRERGDGAGLLRWYADPAGLLGWRIPAYLRRVTALVQGIGPDMLIGGSDALQVIFTRWISKKATVPYCIDLYDNFESFGLSSFPGVLRGYRRALKEARGVMTVSTALGRYIQEQCPGQDVLTIESAVSPGLFRPYPKAEARAFFHLPPAVPLIGTAGSLAASRDTGTLYAAFRRLQQEMPEAYLVLAGPTDGNPPPVHDHIVSLGELPHNQIPMLLSALDMAVICMGDDDFGRYAFPQKAYEMLACEVPVLAAGVGALRDLFSSFPDCLYQPGNAGDLYEKLKMRLRSARLPDILVPSWADQARKVEQFIAAKIRTEIAS